MTEIAADDFSWLEGPAATKALRKPKRRVKKAKRKLAPKKGAKKPKKGKRAAKAAVVKIESAYKLDHESVRGKAMMAAVAGRKRVRACDGQYLFFRRKSCYGKSDSGETIVNEAVKRLDDQVRARELTHVQTQDDVEIYKVNTTSPFYRAPQYLGTMTTSDVRMAIVKAAVKRDWATYLDALTEFAGRVKGAWLAKGTVGQAEIAYQEELKYIDVMIELRGGPSPRECGAGLQNVRMRRGEGQGRMILLPPG